MQTLTRASRELFQRAPDERFSSLQDLWRFCQREKDESVERWVHPERILPVPSDHRLDLALGDDGTFRLSDWSFSQLCKLADVSKDTLNKVSSDSACRVLRETLPAGNKPLQLLTREERVRSIHGASYTRLHNADLLTMLMEFATGFQPPQEAKGGGTGLYCGEQDMFCFMIDPTGWAEIGGEAFAPGFFLWNSEVGRRSIGIQTFWFQAVCQNHIVWDAVEVVEFARKHTANVHDSIQNIRRLVAGLVETRDARRDGFVRVMKKAMETSLGTDAEQVLKTLTRQGITQALAKKALEIAKEKGRFTIFTLVDALTRISGQYEHAGDRAEVDEKTGRLLALAA